MTNLIKGSKTVVVSLLAAAGSSLLSSGLEYISQNSNAIAALLPPKYAGFVGLAVALAAMYHKTPPSGTVGGSGGGGINLSGPAALIAVVMIFLSGGLCGAFSHSHFMAGRGVNRAGYLLATPTRTSARLQLAWGDNRACPPDCPPHNWRWTVVQDTDQELMRPASRLLSVRWDVSARSLCWDVGRGYTVQQADGSDAPVFRLGSTEKNYCVSPDKGQMSYKGETRGFDADGAEEEKSALQAMTHTLMRYAVASVEWWEAGGGVKLKPVAERVAF